MDLLKTIDTRYSCGLPLLISILVFIAILLRGTVPIGRGSAELAPYSADVTELPTGELLRSDSELAMFVDSLVSAELMQAIDHSDAVIVFAPTNAGLLEQGAAFLLQSSVLEDEFDEQLLFKLKSHIAVGQTFPVDLFNTRSAVKRFETLSSVQLPVRLIASEIVVGRDTFVSKTVKTTNGYVFYIDQLLLAQLV